MIEGLSLAPAQLNPTVGDITGNLEKLRKARAEASKSNAKLLMTPELYLCGYPPEDLVLKPSFEREVHEAVHALARDTADGGPAVLLGTPWLENNKLYNAVLMLDGGNITGKVLKMNLPNYGPFDEKRVFAVGEFAEPMVFHGAKLGIIICEDMWTPEVAMHLKRRGAEILLVPNGSPYETGKLKEREELARLRVQETELPLVYLNQIGGQDELVFDGASFVMNKTGACTFRMKEWEEDIQCVSLGDVLKGKPQEHKVSKEEIIYNALLLGLRDYVTKNGFPGVVLGLSGGIDSAVVAALAVDALGADKVWCVMMPSPYTSKESHEDAAALAKNLTCRYDIIPIKDSMHAFDTTLKNVFSDKTPDTTEENIQARARGIILMALSNKFGPMVLSTGNKSEMSVGYSTLYGDLCGGFAVLKDLYKTEVYNIARWRNEHAPKTGLGPSDKIIPERIFTKAPTAELRPNQKDQDSLPPYDVLDGILECLIEKDLGVQEVAGQGYDFATVKKIWSMLGRAEYKRRQAPPGVKITRRILGKDRRYPITNKYVGK